MDAKLHTTGDNDSVEDAMIVITNIKTVDGKYLGFDDAFEAVKKFVSDRNKYLEQALKEKNNVGSA